MWFGVLQLRGRCFKLKERQGHLHVVHTEKNCFLCVEIDFVIMFEMYTQFVLSHMLKISLLENIWRNGAHLNKAWNSENILGRFWFFHAFAWWFWELKGFTGMLNIFDLRLSTLSDFSFCETHRQQACFELQALEWFAHSAYRCELKQFFSGRTAKT